uniref:Uncharacterized protein n=1 Tax=Oryza punctata TaxID=4537 RepID=A0A0E0LVM2_ORYPU
MATGRGQGGTWVLMTVLEEHSLLLVMSLPLAIPMPHATTVKGEMEKKTVPCEAGDACEGRGKYDEKSSMERSLNCRNTVRDRLVELYLTRDMSMVDDHSVSIDVLSVRTNRGPRGGPVVLGSR